MRFMIIFGLFLGLGMGSCVGSTINQNSDRDNELVGEKFSIQSAWQSGCTADSDCVMFASDCCGCNAGGVSTAINKVHLQTAQEKHQAACAEILCAQVFNCTSAVPRCVDSKCTLAP